MYGPTEYRRKSRTLAECIPYAVLIDDGVMLCKDGAFMESYEVRGPDRESLTAVDLKVFRDQLNNVLHRLGTRWSLHTGAHREEVRDYPDSVFPTDEEQFLDNNRRKTFEAVGSTYETRVFLTFTYLPHNEHIGWLRQLFVDKDTSTTAVDYRQEFEYFKDTVASLIGVLSSVMPEVAKLDSSGLLTYLHNCVSTRRFQVATSEIPVFIDEILCDCPVTNGKSFKLGDQHLKVVSIRSYPSHTVPALLYGLEQLPIPYRWCVRWMPMSSPDAIKHITKVRQLWNDKRKSLFTIFKDAIFRTSSSLEDPHALEMIAGADTALQTANQGGVSFGCLTLTVVVWGTDEAEAYHRAKRVQDVVDSVGFASTISTHDQLETFLGGIPGHVYADVRRPVMASDNLCDLIPTYTQWSGPKSNNHLNGPALMHCRTQGSTPFRFCNHIGDVGNVLLIGPVGSGKSVFLGAMAAQCRRYNSQVIMFDSGRGSRALTYAVGGAFFDLGASCTTHDEDRDQKGEQIAFQPLAQVHLESERQWVGQWIITLLEHGGLKVTPKTRKAVDQALENMGKQSPPDQRTISVFQGLVQDQDVRDVLQPFTMSGAYGQLFDASQERFTMSDWMVFETETIRQHKKVFPLVLLYLFHLIEQRLTGRPTFFYVDEGWQVFTHPLFQAQFIEWVRTLRKKNCSIIFSTQSLVDVTDNPIAAPVIDSCPTRVLLPNPQAQDPAVRKEYEQIGLNKQQINLLATAVPKQDYYYSSPEGNRLFDLGLSDVELVLFGSASPQDQQLIDSILTEHGREHFAEHLLRAKGLDVAADEIATLKEGRTQNNGT